MGKIVKRNKRGDGPIVSDHWRTPRYVFTALDEEFGFDLDCAADAENHLTPRWLGPGSSHTDALIERWGDYGTIGFLNPSYSSETIKAFMAHAAQQTVGDPERTLETLVCLLPYDPSVGWWRNTYGAAEVRKIPFRLKFDKPIFDPEGKIADIVPTQAMFPSAVVVYRRQPGRKVATRHLSVWDPRGDVGR